ncbi:hypothetical protein LEP1GSC188_3736 [Leptospira weilii serovar Topaz str. LT2116]|uniref:Uncharacterized protein n=1 Tax=Leptospira weilii serovar Topaz str. LT2116 TaxID=1088540 RepID=M3GUJ4_9LEPT|nr:hypothetical protein LEP1GSC188_3736 [Leptospira weilii serovar Topaz str. LT2116]
MLSSFNAIYLATFRERDLSLGELVPEFPLILDRGLFHSLRIAK